MTQYVSDTCEVTTSANKKSVIADVLAFREKQFLSVSINRNFKIELRWDGLEYEGRQAGLTFTSKGPIITNTTTAKR